MKALLLKSNQGNHSGFNRTWEILSEFDSDDAQIEVSKALDNLADKYDLTEEEVSDLYSSSGFEYDLCYYTVITKEQYDNGIFSGGHFGYASIEVTNYFTETVLL